MLCSAGTHANSITRRGPALKISIKSVSSNEHPNLKTQEHKPPRGHVAPAWVLPHRRHAQPYFSLKCCHDGVISASLVLRCELLCKVQGGQFRGIEGCWISLACKQNPQHLSILIHHREMQGEGAPSKKTQRLLRRHIFDVLRLHPCLEFCFVLCNFRCTLFRGPLLLLALYLRLPGFLLHPCFFFDLKLLRCRLLDLEAFLLLLFLTFQSLDTLTFQLRLLLALTFLCLLRRLCLLFLLRASSLLLLFQHLLNVQLHCIMDLLGVSAEETPEDHGVDKSSTDANGWGTSSKNT
mmetsp:Transcript_34737/g.92753  ORF Transcript_34737/g.92753 Transcript_34737/m.92753 type:complete len:294 (+) Transcript_34737:166-1047(+)